MEKGTFVFREEWRDAISGLSDEVRLEFYEAVIEYGISGKTSDLKQMARLAFNFAKADIDRDIAHDMAIRAKRRESGKKGGAPKGNSNASGRQNKQMVVLDDNHPETSKNKQKQAKQANGCLVVFEGEKSGENSGLINCKTISCKTEQAKQANGCLVVFDENFKIKESPLSSPLEENTPKPLKEDIPPIIPQESPQTIVRTCEASGLRKRDSDVAKRCKVFVELLRPYIATYGRDMLNDFFAYWSELNKSGTKMRFELEKTWDLSRRLRRWASTNKKFDNHGNRKQYSTPEQRTADAARDIAAFLFEESD